MAREPFWPWLPAFIQTGPQQNGSWTLLVSTMSAHSNWSSWGATPWQGRQSLGDTAATNASRVVHHASRIVHHPLISVVSKTISRNWKTHKQCEAKLWNTHTHTHTLTCVHPHHPTHITQHSHNNNKSKQTRQKWRKHANISKFDYGTTILQQCTM